MSQWFTAIKNYIPQGVFALLSFLPKPEGAESAPASRKKQMGSQLPDQETRDGCLQEVMQVFPDISPDYLQELSDKTYYSASEIILRIVERQESGMDYPRRQKKGVKRKLSEMESMEHEMESVKRKYTVTDAERAARLQSARDRNTMIRLLRADFAHIPEETIASTLVRHKFVLFSTYLELHDVPGGISDPPPAIGQSFEILDGVERAFQREVLESRRYCQLRATLRARRLAAEQAEKDNFEAARAQGLVEECGCCFADTALNRMVGCEGSPSHLFCYACAVKLAETVIGQSRYKLECMSLDNCEAGFSAKERAKFLDERLTMALDRIEQQTMLRSAELDDVAMCPFCPFAAEYPPIEEDREFRCQNPDCEVVSCRLCGKVSHVPYECEEAAAKNGTTARQQIEEAMSAAVVRKCNKCGTPFIKEFGCNKVTCSRAGCYNVQCYICSASCDYKHFGDRNSGQNVEGLCPLFDDSAGRHTREADAAGRETRQRIAEENPEIDPEYLAMPNSPVPRTADRRPRRGLRVHRRDRDLDHDLLRWANEIARGQEDVPEHNRDVLAAGEGDPEEPSDGSSWGESEDEAEDEAQGGPAGEADEEAEGELEGEEEENDDEYEERQQARWEEHEQQVIQMLDAAWGMGLADRLRHYQALDAELLRNLQRAVPNQPVGDELVPEQNYQLAAHHGQQQQEQQQQQQQQQEQRRQREALEGYYQFGMQLNAHPLHRQQQLQQQQFINHNGMPHQQHHHPSIANYGLHHHQVYVPVLHALPRPIPLLDTTQSVMERLMNPTAMQAAQSAQPMRFGRMVQPPPRTMGVLALPHLHNAPQDAEAMAAAMRRGRTVTGNGVIGGLPVGGEQPAPAPQQMGYPPPLPRPMLGPAMPRFPLVANRRLLHRNAMQPPAGNPAHPQGLAVPPYVPRFVVAAQANDGRNDVPQGVVGMQNVAGPEGVNFEGNSQS